MSNVFIKHNKRILLFTAETAILALTMLLLSSCSIKSESAGSSAFLMGTVVSEKIYGKSGAEGEKILEEIEESISDCENKISWRISSSDTAVLNESGTADVTGSEELWETVCRLYRDTGGSFDVTVGKLTTLWNIGTEDARIPSESEIKEALKYVDGSQLTFNTDEGMVNAATGQFIDLGAVGKGYACDRAREVLKENGVEGACIAVGGSVLCYGTHDGKNTYSVGVRDPEGSVNDCLAVITVSECVVSTSGDYEHVLKQDGNKYHHIIDTKTGYPVQTDLAGVTVISSSGLLSDALSTACFSLGENDGRKLLDKYGAEGIFVYHDKTISFTDGINIKLQGEYHEKTD